jgi:DNA-binding response OmpR family regulator
MSRVLLVEDDRKLALYTAEALARHGFQTTRAGDGLAALELLERQPFDIILLDLTLPRLDGLEVARRIRQRWQTPLIIVTARDEHDERVVGLELGADDYVAKPTHPRELVARMRAVLRRSQSFARDDERWRCGPLSVDLTTRTAHLGDRLLMLTSQEFDLLAVLVRNAGRVLSRDRLLELLKGEAADRVFDRAIDVQVSRLRGKLEDDPRQPRYLKTVRSAGYLLVAGE